MDMIQMWWLSIAIFAIVIVVVAVLLGLIVATAKSIDRHASDIWTVGKQIAGNTVSIWMFARLNHRLGAIGEHARGIEREAASIRETLQRIPGGS